MKNTKEKIIAISKDEIGKLYLMLCDKDLSKIPVGEVIPLLEAISESITDRILPLFSLQKQEIVEDIEKEIQQIEKDGLSIGLERQS